MLRGFPQLGQGGCRFHKLNSGLQRLMGLGRSTALHMPQGGNRPRRRLHLRPRGL